MRFAWRYPHCGHTLALPGFRKLIWLAAVIFFFLPLSGGLIARVGDGQSKNANGVSSGQGGNTCNRQCIAGLTDGKIVWYDENLEQILVDMTDNCLFCL